MDNAKAVGYVPLDWITLPEGILPWEKYETIDIFATNFITVPPKNYMLTLGSAIPISFNHIYSSLATIPNYTLPTNSQYYIAGRDIIRWGGEKDPYEIDFDRYVFTPVFDKKIAVVSLAPKSEPHHLSEVPELYKVVSKGWREIFDAIRKGKLP